MTRLPVMILYCFISSVAYASTFELEDPAQQFLEEKEEPVASQPGVGVAPIENLACTVDIDTGACYCIDKRSDTLLEMMPTECADMVRSALDKKESY